MSTLRQHFQQIKSIVDWSWTLAIFCMVGYITLGQLVQLYYAMIFLGGLAASFGLFYNFSCQKLAEIEALEDAYNLQKAINTSAAAYNLLRNFANRNPEIVNQFPQFLQTGQQVRNINVASHAKFQRTTNEQTQAFQNRTPQPGFQNRATQPSPSNRRSTRSAPQRTIKQKLTPEEYRWISNKSDYVYVKAHFRNGSPVRAHYRRRPER